MSRWLMAAVCGIACAAAGCQEEVISVRGSTLDKEFSQFNKNGWSVSGGDVPARGSASAAPTAPTSRVIKEADFSHMQFNTNLQVDDPIARAKQHAQAQTRPAQSQPAPAPSLMPFGAPLPGQ